MGDLALAAGFLPARVELIAAVAREGFAVKSRAEIVKALPQFVGAHVRGAEINIEQRASLPRAIMRQPALLLELAV